MGWKYIYIKRGQRRAGGELSRIYNIYILIWVGNIFILSEDGKGRVENWVGIYNIYIYINMGWKYIYIKRRRKRAGGELSRDV